MAKPTTGFQGLDQFVLALHDLPIEIRKHKPQINQGAKNALKPAMNVMKGKIKQDSIGRKHGGRMGFSHLVMLSRMTKVYAIKSRHQFGASVRFNDNMKIPIHGKVGTRWSAQSVGKLFAEGNYKTPGRKGRGNFKGFGNWAKESQALFAGTMRRRFVSSISKEIHKASVRALRRRGFNG